MQLGESIAVGLFVGANVHSTSTCPWHSDEPPKAAKVMPKQEGDEDAPSGIMPDNSGKKLGTALTQAGNPAPPDKAVEVYYEQDNIFRYPAGKKKKTLQIYRATVDKEEYDLQYAPHHLIPGNESLKGSDVAAFLGADNVITNFKLKGEPSSLIKDGKSVGYDVNAASNGEWLPSPYALSMSNEWPAAEGLKALRRRLRDGEDEAAESEAFKMAYAVAAMEVTPRKQFHMRHAEYSTKVREILDAMAAKMEFLVTSKKGCPLAKNEAEDGKFNPPMALAKRLDALSRKLRGLVSGSPTGWRNPLFLDELTQTYFEEFKGKPKKIPNLKVM
jgi:hypothetical protein